MWNGWVLTVVLIMIWGIVVSGVNSIREVRSSTFVRLNWEGIYDSFKGLGYRVSFNEQKGTLTIRFMGSAKKGYRDESRPIGTVKFHKLLKRLEKVRKPEARPLIEELIGLEDVRREEPPKATPEAWKIGNKVEEEK